MNLENYRLEGHVMLMEKITEYLLDNFEDFPVSDNEFLLDLVVSIDTDTVSEFFERHKELVKPKIDNFEFISYDFVKLIRLYDEFVRTLLKKELDACDVLADEIYLLSHLYLPKIIDEEVIEQFKEWNFNTYGPGERLTGTIEHIKKELEEIEKEPHDLVEWVDVIMLAMNGALRHGHEPQAIIDAFFKKFEINKKRKWKDWREVPEGEPITHIKE